MSPRRVVSSNFPFRDFHFDLRPATAWAAILGFVLLSALCILAGAGDVLRLVFPVGSFAVGAFLYWRYPILYLGFTWWLWFLTPCVRRLVDYRTGWTEPSPVLLAPHLAVLVTLVTFLRYIPKLYSQEGLPFFLSFTAVLYGCLIGLINATFGDNSRLFEEVIGAGGFTHTPTNVLVDTLEWLTPVIFSFHLVVNWKYYPEYRQNIRCAFNWGVLLIGAYGVLQYLVAPEWDRFWLMNISNTSFGRPEPLEIRVFSTMNSPGTFASMMMTGLLLLLTEQRSLNFFATPVGYLAFLLTLVRSAWGGWFLGLLITINSLKPRAQMRLSIVILIVGMFTFSLAAVEPFSDLINTRAQSLSNIQEDGSYQDRVATYNRALWVALSEPWGNGLGLPGVDSAIINILFAIGWFGSILYLGGIVLLLFKLAHSNERRFDPFLSSAVAISLSMLAQLVFGNALIGFQGIICWSFLGFILAAHKYYQYQFNAESLRYQN